jgi:hypothetical protein
MTEKEAIAEMQSWKETLRGVRIRQAFNTTLKVLEKWTPQKVLYEDIGYDTNTNENLYACKCPSCALGIIVFGDSDIKDDYDSNDDNVEKMFHSSMNHHAYIGLNNFCNRCGQRLKW